MEGEKDYTIADLFFVAFLFFLLFTLFNGVAESLGLENTEIVSIEASTCELDYLKSEDYIIIEKDKCNLIKNMYNKTVLETEEHIKEVIE